MFRLLACCLVYLLFIQVYADRQVGQNIAAVDYRSFYAAGYLARTNPAKLYDLAEQARVQQALVGPNGAFLPFYHPAYEALLYAPFSLLPYGSSYRLMLLANVALAGFIVFTLPGITTLQLPVLRLYPAIGLFASVPVLIAVVEGQDSLLYLSLACVAWHYFSRGRDLLAGLLLGLMLLRFQLTLPLLVLLLLRRRFALLPGFLLAAFFVASVSFRLIGLQGTETFFHLLQASSLAHDPGSAAHAMAIHPLSMPNLRGLLYAIFSLRLAPAHLAALTFLLSIAVFVLTVYLSARIKGNGQVFAAALLCSMLVSYHMNLYDLSLLVLPLLLLRSRVALWIAAWLYAGAFVAVFYLGSAMYYLLAVPSALLLLAALWEPTNAPIERADEPTGMLTGTRPWLLLTKAEGNWFPCREGSLAAGPGCTRRQPGPRVID